MISDVCVAERLSGMVFGQSDSKYDLKLPVGSESTINSSLVIKALWAIQKRRVPLHLLASHDFCIRSFYYLRIVRITRNLTHLKAFCFVDISLLVTFVLFCYIVHSQSTSSLVSVARWLAIMASVSMITLDKRSARPGIDAPPYP
jgi:hypothetical protein